MKSLPYWIQRADFSATDYEPTNVATAIGVFEVHRWDDELELQSALENQGRACCPPGIGFVDPDGPILHVCPAGDGRSLVHFHAHGDVRTRNGMLQDDVLALIHRFFGGQHDWIHQKLDAG
jgi:hypothetical protein